MNRAARWLVGGLVVLVLAVVAIAPELLTDLGAAGSVLGVALVALVPAALVAALFVSTRRRRPDRSTPTDASGVDRPDTDPETPPPAAPDHPGA